MKFLTKEDIKTYYKFLYNPKSILGFILIVTSIAVLFGLFLIDSVSQSSSSYIGILVFMILPPFFITGTILVPYGFFQQFKKLHAKGEIQQKNMIIDFNLGKHRKNFLIFIFFGFVSIICVTLISFQSFHYTESVEFCSSCHSVMDPETIRHQKSPHARVTCVECHVGEGTSWYVKSKLSGMYQVYSVWFNKYSRPIETPISNLRPARDTCEKCHWPQYFIDNKIVSREYVLPDEENTIGHETLIMKTGGMKKHAKPSGIHWHISNTVNFIARDPKKEDIPWIEVINDEGQHKIFQSSENPLKKEEIANSEIHRMDCIDCHNRPAHIFLAPSEIMDNLILSGVVNKDLPNIRAIGSQVMVKDYKDNTDADIQIKNQILKEYSEKELTPELKTTIDSTIKAIQTSYHENFFPQMKTNWKTHSKNIGHKWSPGCFRCHDDKHTTDSGEVIPRNCDLCHTIAAQGVGRSSEKLSLVPLEFKHPEDIDEEWKETPCYECHTGE